jgi:putative DNA-invertase from lambdoid prophage Rac
MTSTAPALRVATYHRVSTFDQDPSLARGELAAAAARLGGQVVLAVEETGSGARNDRPGLQRLMAAARRGKVDVVMVWKLDRFGRSALDVLANIRELDGAGVRFIATTQGLDVRPGGDAMSRLILGVLASVAEFERDIIRERTRLGLAKAKASGKRLGRRFVLSDKQVAKVKAMRAAKASWAQVAAGVGCKVGAARLAAARAA